MSLSYYCCFAFLTEVRPILAEDHYVVPLTRVNSGIYLDRDT
jgi:hypothetical protein